MAMPPRNYKRKADESATNLKRLCKSPAHPIMDWVRSISGVRRRIVLFYSSLDSPYTILHNATDRISSAIHVVPADPANRPYLFHLRINDEVICEGMYGSEPLAKRGLAELAVHSLQTTCFSIFRKIHPKDSPLVEISGRTASTAPTCEKSVINEASSVVMMDGVGAQLMRRMGWAGGGLGSEGQGRMDIILPYIQIERQGLGSDNIIREVRERLEMYARSKDINSIAFSCDFTKEERASIHQVARRLQLKSKSYGKEERTLVIQTKISAWDLVHSLLDSGGETEQYKLILPSNFLNQN